jgi:hypothetical protein
LAYGKIRGQSRYQLFKAKTVINIMFYGTNVSDRGAPKWGLPGCSPPNTPKLKFKNTDFVNTMISRVLRDLPCSQIQPLKSADE